MSLYLAGLLAKIGFLSGCGVMLVLLVADYTTWDDNHGLTMPTPVHAIVGWVTVAVILGCTIVHVTVWAIRILERFIAAAIREAVAEVARSQRLAAVQPAPAPAAVPADNVRAFELGRDVERERANGHRRG